MINKYSERIKKNELCTFLFCVAIVCCVGGVCGKNKPGLWIEDEFGYYGVAALVTGFDWKQVYSGLGYYGFGLGLLLIPGFLIGKSPSFLMGYTLLLNVSLLVGTFVLTIRLVKKIFPKRNIFILYLGSLLATLYINNLAQLQMGWSESLNLFLYWCTLNCYCDVITKNKVSNYLILSLILCVSIMVHMRNVVIVFPCVVLLMIYSIKKRKINIKGSICFTIFAFLGAVCFFGIKSYIQSNLYGVNDGQQNNDVGIVLDSYGALFNLNYANLFWKGIWSKIFYVVSATFGLIGIGLIESVNIVRKREEDVEQSIILLALLIFCCSFALSVINTLAPVRMDTMFYGRYFDANIGIIVILGFLYLCKPDDKIWKKIVCVDAVILIYKISYIITDKYFLDSLPAFKGALTFPCITGIAKYFNMNIGYENIVTTIFSAVIEKMLCLVICIFIFDKVEKRSYRKKNVLCIVLSLYFIINQVGDAKEVVDWMIYYEDIRYEYVDLIAQSIDEDWDTVSNSQVYYYHNTNSNEMIQADILALQFKIGKNPIQLIEKIDNLTKEKYKQYIVLNKKEGDYEYKKKSVDSTLASMVCQTEMYELYLIE